MEVKLYLAFAAILLTAKCSFGQAITDKSWTYQSILVVSDDLQDTSNVFSLGGQEQLLQVGENKLIFKSDSSYSALIKKSVSVSGTWKINNTDFIMDGDTMAILQMTGQEFSLKGNYVYLDTAANFREGYLLIKFVVSNESVESIKSGVWNDPATWSSNRIPNKSDYVIIKQSHTVIFPENETGYCKNILVETGAVFDCKTTQSFHINPNGN